MRKNECNGGRRDAEKLKPHRRFPSPLRNRRKSQIIHSMWDEAAVTVLGSVIVGLRDGTSVFVNFKQMDGKEEYSILPRGNG
jgi:hypothetical protein